LPLPRSRHPTRARRPAWVGSARGDPERQVWRWLTDDPRAVVQHLVAMPADHEKSNLRKALRVLSETMWG
jgi:hypothetical protein